MILGLEGQLFDALAACGEDPGRTVAAYREVMNARDASYFRIEALGEAHAPPASREEQASGYDRIGLAVIRARLGEAPAEIVVNTRNRAVGGGPAVPELRVGDTVETTARVGPQGISPSPQPPLPVAAAALLRRVKNVEREIVRAALAGDLRTAAEALREHPAGGAAAASVFPRLRLPEPSGDGSHGVGLS